MVNGLAKNMKDNTIVTAFRPVVTETWNILIIRLQARVFYERIVKEAQLSWLSLKENKDE